MSTARSIFGGNAMTSKKRTTSVNQTKDKVQLRALSIIVNLLQENEQLKENLKGVAVGFEKFIKDVTAHSEASK